MVAQIEAVCADEIMTKVFKKNANIFWRKLVKFGETFVRDIRP
jgi:hypothetical protein